MDAKQAQLEQKLADLLEQASKVASQLQAAEQGPGTPHYDQIEIPAHEVGQRLSRMIQSAREIANGCSTTRSTEPPVASAPNTWPSSWRAIIAYQLSAKMAEVNKSWWNRCISATKLRGVNANHHLDKSLGYVRLRQ